MREETTQLAKALWEHCVSMRWWGFECRCGLEFDRFSDQAAIHQAEQGLAALGYPK